MSARILDGKGIAAQVRAEIAAETKALGIVPGLCVIQVGENAASTTYVNSKERTAKEAGFHSVVERYPESITEAALLARIEELNRDPRIHGFFVQLPLPKHISPERVQRAVDPAKDVDGFHPVNQGLLLLGEPRILPATPRGIVELLARAGVSPAGKRVVVLGRSTIVGKPLAAAFLLKGARGDATVTVAHSRTPDLPALCREADILVAAIGQAKMVKADWVKPGAIVVDVGTNRDEHGKQCGDVDFDHVKEVAGAITPVPGGVGPMTIAMLMRNTLDAARAQLGK